MSTVYVLRAKGTNLVKIGFTAGDVEERRRALQTGCPHELVVELTFAGTMEDERRAHERWTDRRRVGEWFELTAGEVKATTYDLWFRENQRRLGDLRSSFEVTFGRNVGEMVVTPWDRSIQLFCEAVSEAAFDPRLNGQSSQCLRCGAETACVEEGDDEDPDWNLGHARGCPVPWLARAAAEMRKARG
jgi:hypothetical protein